MPILVYIYSYFLKYVAMVIHSVGHYIGETYRCPISILILDGHTRTHIPIVPLDIAWKVLWLDKITDLYPIIFIFTPPPPPIILSTIIQKINENHLILLSVLLLDGGGGREFQARKIWLWP